MKEEKKCITTWISATNGPNGYKIIVWRISTSLEDIQLWVTERPGLQKNADIYFVSISWKLYDSFHLHAFSFSITVIMNRYIILYTYDAFKYFSAPFFTLKYTLELNTLAVQFMVYLHSVWVWYSLHFLYSTCGFAEVIAEELYRFTYSKNLFYTDSLIFCI